MQTTMIPPTRLVVLDSYVLDAEKLLAGMDLNVRTLLVDRDEAALFQVVFTLAALAKDNERPAALDFVTHGRPGAMFLGGRTIDITAVEADALLFGAIGKGLAPHGVVHLWSRDAGTGRVGRAFVNRLSRAIGRPVAGSPRRLGAGVAWTLDNGSRRAASEM